MTLARFFCSVVGLGMLHLLAAPGSEATHPISPFMDTRGDVESVLRRQYELTADANMLVKNGRTDQFFQRQVWKSDNWIRERHQQFDLSELPSLNSHLWQLELQQQQHVSNGKPVRSSLSSDKRLRGDREANSSRAWSTKTIIMLVLGLLLVAGLVVLVLSLTTQ